MTAPVPFVIKRNQITAEGGVSKEPLVVEYRTVAGDERNWFALGISYRNLARNFGLDTDAPNPSADTNVISVLQTLRNEKVDELLFMQQVDKDPMGSSARKAPKLTKGRVKAFSKAGLPCGVNTKLPPFKDYMGEDVPELTMSVLSSPKTNSILEIELNAANMDWLAKAIWTDWGVDPAKRERMELSGLPELTEPNVKWARIGNGCPRIKATYRKPDGRIGYISKAVPMDLIQDQELVARVTVEFEKAVQTEYNEKHTPEYSES